MRSLYSVRAGTPLTLRLLDVQYLCSIYKLLGASMCQVLDGLIVCAHSTALRHGLMGDHYRLPGITSTQLLPLGNFAANMPTVSPVLKSGRCLFRSIGSLCFARTQFFELQQIIIILKQMDNHGAHFISSLSLRDHHSFTFFIPFTSYILSSYIVIYERAIPRNTPLCLEVPCVWACNLHQYHHAIHFMKLLPFSDNIVFSRSVHTAVGTQRLLLLTAAYCSMEWVYFFQLFHCSSDRCLGCLLLLLTITKNYEQYTLK